MNLITFTDIIKTYRVGSSSNTILDRISLEVKTGDRLAIVGTSGSGKSTLMNLIGLLDKADQGKYYYRNHDVSTLDDNTLAELRNRSFGFVFQQFHLLAKLTAIHNVALPLLYRNMPLKEALHNAEAMLLRVGMQAFSEHRPTQLSGGQQQRIAIARALIGEPDIILADEPTGALDSSTGNEIMQLLLTLNNQGKTVIIVTHDERIALQCTQRIQLQNGKINRDSQ
ncbi:MAG: ABC transporter ATP-binding protein [Legionellaceae bacterium]|nr:ABC transporter ATP-binding protein [Legionellaceae bacterium]